MALDPKLLEILACPEDKGPLLYFADEQTLYNPRLHRRYRVLDGDIPDLLIDDAESVDDAEHARLVKKADDDGVKPPFEQGPTASVFPTSSPDCRNNSLTHTRLPERSTRTLSLAARRSATSS